MVRKIKPANLCFSAVGQLPGKSVQQLRLCSAPSSLACPTQLLRYFCLRGEQGFSLGGEKSCVLNFHEGVASHRLALF